MLNSKTFYNASKMTNASIIENLLKMLLVKERLHHNLFLLHQNNTHLRR